MTLFKRALFYALFIPMGILVLLVELFGWTCHILVEGCHRFEGRALDYNRHHTYIGEGIWVGKTDGTRET